MFLSRSIRSRNASNNHCQKTCLFYSNIHDIDYLGNACSFLYSILQFVGASYHKSLTYICVVPQEDVSRLLILWSLFLFIFDFILFCCFHNTLQFSNWKQLQSIRVSAGTQVRFNINIYNNSTTTTDHQPVRHS